MNIGRDSDEKDLDEPEERVTEKKICYTGLIRCRNYNRIIVEKIQKTIS